MDDHLADSDDDEIRPAKKKKIHQSIETDIPPRATKKRQARASTDTVSADTPQLTTSSHTKVGVSRRRTKHRRVSTPSLARYSEGLDIWLMSQSKRYFKHDRISFYNADTRDAQQELASTASPSSGEEFQPPLDTYSRSSSPSAAGDMGDAPRFPETPPSNVDETIQRTMAVINEVNKLLPHFPAIEAHLKSKSQLSQVQVHEDTAQVRQTTANARPATPFPGLPDFEKENVQDTSRENRILDDAFGDEDIMGHGAFQEMEGEAERDTEVIHQRSGANNARAISSEHMLPPGTLPQRPSDRELPENLSSALTQVTQDQPPLRFSQTRGLQLLERPSTGNTPAHSQVNGDLRPPFDSTLSSRTISLGSQRESGVETSTARERTVKDTHLTLSQSAALNEGSQIVLELTQDHLLSSTGHGLGSEGSHFDDAIRAG